MLDPFGGSAIKRGISVNATVAARRSSRLLSGKSKYALLNVFAMTNQLITYIILCIKN